MNMRKTIRAVTALTFGLLMASSGYAAQTVVINHDCHGCGNFSGNVVASNNHIDNHVIAHSFNGNSILSNNIVVTGGSVVGGGNSLALSNAVSVVTHSGNSTQTQTTP
jgi:hypothetical protein